MYRYMCQNVFQTIRKSVLKNSKIMFSFINRRKKGVSGFNMPPEQEYKEPIAVFTQYRLPGSVMEMKYRFPSGSKFNPYSEYGSGTGRWGEDLKSTVPIKNDVFFNRIKLFNKLNTVAIYRLKNRTNNFTQIVFFFTFLAD